VGRVGFLVGCVADLYLARTNQATLEVLAANGLEVVMPPAAVCCGALHVHRGMMQDARDLAKATIAGFEAEPDLVVLTNSAGCGSTLKEYGELFHGDPAWEARAAAFAKRVQDVSEYLATRELRAPGPLPRLVAYDDPCHLLHGQGISKAPRELLKRIPELTLKPLPESDWCCGSAGIYSVTHAPMSLAILRRKVEKILETAPQAVATGNPGCLLHLRAGLTGRGIPVVHVMDLLAEAYRQRNRGSNP
jgi:glycolate oxidase iron-sulfur subunit